MRSLLILALVFAAGFFLGHEFWPEAHEDPGYHLRFHRGRLPYAPSVEPSQATLPVHGRVHLPATVLSSPTPQSSPTLTKP